MNSLAQKKYPLCPSALTLLEMVIALGIISILFAVALPAFTSAGKSWQSRQSSSEVIQNGRVLVDYIHNQLSKSIKIIDVSDPAETNGYIEFEDASGTTQRFDIAANNYVQFGEPGSQSELAGPVSTLQFTCYAIDDLDTPVTDPEIIRFVKVQTNLVNASSRRNDKTFVTSAFLQTNGNVPAVGSVISKFEFDSKACEDPVLVKIDDEHYLCAYTGNFNDGFAVVLIVDPDTLEISKGPSFEFENSTGFSASLVKIDSTHYLCAYANQGFMGMAGVLVVDPADWSITRQTTFDFELQKCLYPVLTAIDSSHFLCSYAGFGDDGFAKILTVDTGTWQITEEDVLEYDKKKGAYPVLSQIDSGHYLCAYSGDADDGWALVLTVNTGSWKLSANMKHEFDNVNCITPDLSKIDSTHYLCTYTGADDGGVANILEINPVNYSVSSYSAGEFNTEGMQTSSLAQIDADRFLCVYEYNPEVQTHKGRLNVLTVDTGNWTTTAGLPFEFESDKAEDTTVIHINGEYYLAAYCGPDDDGWAAVLQINSELIVFP